MGVNSQKPLTPRQKRVIDFITNFVRENGYPPSFMEIGKSIGKSLGSIQHYIRELQNKGYLTKEENSVRGISPVLGQRGSIFLLGYIAAGEPIEPLENPEPVEVPIEMISAPGDYYALKVRGDSMIDDNILDGDTIVVRYQQTAEGGERVVVITENGATLKILRKRNGKFYLEPRNKNLKPLYPQSLEIRGKYIGLIRREI